MDQPTHTRSWFAPALLGRAPVERALHVGAKSYASAELSYQAAVYPNSGLFPVPPGGLTTLIQINEGNGRRMVGISKNQKRG